MHRALVQWLILQSRALTCVRAPSDCDLMRDQKCSGQEMRPSGTWPPLSDYLPSPDPLQVCPLSLDPASPSIHCLHPRLPSLLPCCLNSGIQTTLLSCFSLWWLPTTSRRKRRLYRDAQNSTSPTTWPALPHSVPAPRSPSLSVECVRPLLSFGQLHLLFPWPGRLFPQNFPLIGPTSAVRS